MDQVFAISSYGAMMTWGYAKKLEQKKKLNLCNSCTSGEKQKSINDFR
jgi:hypothetical protein